jgi:ribonucleoside-diphosphate reductase alpha chain
MDKNEESIYRELGRERKRLQKEGLVPEWCTTSAWQIIKEKILTEEDVDLKSIYTRISKCAAAHTEDPLVWEKKFFDIMWKGYLACSTPVIANMGTDRGCPVSCSGSVIEDNVYAFYDSQKEVAVLSQNGFGTSSYLGGIRERGASISRGGSASGILPVLKDFIQVSRDITQGSTRRGAWAGYLEIDHADFWEVADFIVSNPDDCNIGWNVSNAFIQSLNAGDEDSISRYQRAMKVKMLTGKGYFFFIDKANAANPTCYVDKGLSVKASNLCSEITLHSDEDHTYTCVLSSMNLSMYDKWKDTDAVFVATVFLDCVASEFIKMGTEIRGLEKAVRFTEKSRALGLGTLGFHTYLQKKSIAFESMDAYWLNQDIYINLNEEATKASKWMAEEYGEPEWLEGYGLRNSHLIAIAPNLSSALICGGVSQGIEPVYKNAYVQGSVAGEINRINPVLVDIMKEKKVFNPQNIDSIISNGGSVQHVDYLTDHEKDVFKTAFEIDQHTIIRLASTRQPYICQAQSINLFFAADAPESYISSVHKTAFNDKKVKSLYYIRSEAGVTGSDGECVACEG